MLFLSHSNALDLFCISFQQFLPHIFPHLLFCSIYSLDYLLLEMFDLHLTFAHLFQFLQHLLFLFHIFHNHVVSLCYFTIAMYLFLATKPYASAATRSSSDNVVGIPRFFSNSYGSPFPKSNCGSDLFPISAKFFFATSVICPGFGELLLPFITFSQLL